MIHRGHTVQTTFVPCNGNIPENRIASYDAVLAAAAVGQLSPSQAFCGVVGGYWSLLKVGKGCSSEYLFNRDVGGASNQSLSVHVLPLSLIPTGALLVKGYFVFAGDL